MVRRKLNRNLQSLNTEQWVYRPVIDFYLRLLNKSSEIFPISFKLRELVEEDEIHMKYFCTMIKLLIEATQSILLVPTLYKKHWSLRTMDTKTLSIKIFDSLRDARPCDAQKLLEMMAEINRQKFKIALKWKLVVDQQWPQQANSYNCGIYVRIAARMEVDQSSTPKKNPRVWVWVAFFRNYPTQTLFFTEFFYWILLKPQIDLPGPSGLSETYLPTKCKNYKRF